MKPEPRSRPGQPWALPGPARAAAAAGVAALALLAATAGAQEADTPERTAASRAPATLSGTLAKVRASGSIALGYRQASVPFSYLNARNEPIGYSIELCKALVTSIEDAVNRSLAIRWVPVTADNRVDAVASGKVDLECGSTTSNLERQKRVAFSPIMFVAGTKVMVRQDTQIRSLRDLASKKVAVTAGTTNEKAMRDLDRKFHLGMQLQVVPDHSQGFAQVAGGQSDAFATDDVLLYGLIAENAGKAEGNGGTGASQGARLQVVGDYLSYDPYAIMFRKDDPQLAQVVRSSFQALAEDGEIERQYRRWFLRRLPSGTSLDLPMSAQLQTLIETLAAQPR
ncbi:MULTISPECIES: amino acid ABC transporter substrate-binding protein [unclassified Delftia]|uniref:amino acid ABC transporter substrate-binding protein n=1 Tax=unclassified Delftia TaxID=2613839 RepID=UPI0018FF76F3|nr:MULTISPECIES: amino acid ABC transporter substrate-binding protein [unclassified Delftia]MBK0115483.1 amino acid ABC transporter substrate-binding protein [Delftia sp. S65]MBK0119098.1 amino acid ABC transporter substrate-binding protein [Delftia sp. S67]MBK0130430.1 amino acid ABC transporter substrate-binding protein [Delftia sp. S66]